jgi:hypothetical protein
MYGNQEDLLEVSREIVLFETFHNNESVSLELIGMDSFFKHITKLL